ncbi:hypothetical protein F2P56_001578, partial [Juglans regia]
MIKEKKKGIKAAKAQASPLLRNYLHRARMCHRPRGAICQTKPTEFKKKLRFSCPVFDSFYLFFSLAKENSQLHEVGLRHYLHEYCIHGPAAVVFIGFEVCPMF